MSRPLPRYTEPAITHDPLLALITRREAQIAHTRAQILNGTYLTPDPADLRGIPCLAKGVGGTSPGTNPLAALLRPTR